MEKAELIKRAEDLSARCERTGKLTHTLFLTPAERYELTQCAAQLPVQPAFFGGHEACERTAAFFLPYYMEADSFSPVDYIRAIRLTAHFGEPGHRDYMGALLGMGIGREWLGDIWVDGSVAYAFCMDSVSAHLLSLDKVGRCGVSAQSIELQDLPQPKRDVGEISFSVMSTRLDAVTAGMFKLSRTEASKRIAAGLVSVNYTECLKPDLTVADGDIISVRGVGKGRFIGTGGTSRKGRLFVYAEIYK